MSRYNTFLTVFITACITIAVFVLFYLQSFFAMAINTEHGIVHESHDFFYFFNQQIIISGIVTVIANLAYRILGIVYISKIKSLTDVEKVVWALGFIFFGFVVAIVFLLIAKNRKFLD